VTQGLISLAMYLIYIFLEKHQVIFFKWAHLGLSKIISDYLLYLEKINIFFNIITTGKTVVKSSTKLRVIGEKTNNRT
jgi:hypothetical protein